MTLRMSSVCSWSSLRSTRNSRATLARSAPLSTCWSTKSGNASRRRLLDRVDRPTAQLLGQGLQGQVGLVDGLAVGAQHLHLGQLPAIHVFGQRHDGHLFVGDLVGDVHLDVRAVLLGVGIEAKPNSIRPQAALVAQEANRGDPAVSECRLVSVWRPPATVVP